MELIYEGCAGGAQAILMAKDRVNAPAKRDVGVPID
jgi:hypothetical protein